MAERETIQISPINTRQRIPQEAIDDVVDQIIQHYQPHKIILETRGS